MTHICVSKLNIIGSDNGLAPGRRQAIIWTNAGIWLIRTIGTNFNEILIDIHTLSFKKMHLKMSSGKCRPFCLGHNVLIDGTVLHIPSNVSMVRDLVCFVVVRIATDSSISFGTISLDRVNDATMVDIAKYMIWINRMNITTTKQLNNKLNQITTTK